ncbi:chaperone modulator CbpM [Thermodesulfobacteriota bacterium]
MGKKYWTITEITHSLKIEETFIVRLEEEDLIHSAPDSETSGKVFTAKDVEKLRLAKTLMEDMEVNLPGVEVILRMRKNMFEMREQFDNILEDLAKQLQKTMKQKKF